MKLTVITAPDIEVEIAHETSVYAPRSHCYLVPDNKNFLEWAKSMYLFETEKNEWIRKYENVLEGLKYWKGKAEENNT